MLRNVNDISENLHESIQNNLNNNAIFVDDNMYTYSQVYERSLKIKSTLLKHIKKSEQFIGILCYRSIDVYAGILGVLFSKNAYLPINPLSPKENIKKIITFS